MTVALRKIALCTEEISHDNGPPLTTPLRRGWVAAVIKNPFAGAYVEDIAWMMDALKPLGIECSRRLVDALGGDPKAVQAYGKGALVGALGEVEHGALWHVPGGYAMRELLGQALAIVPSAAKMGALGAALDVPMHHINAAYVRSHFDAMTVTVPDGPRPDEILFCLVMSTGPRPHARVGGLDASEIAKWDGQR